MQKKQVAILSGEYQYADIGYARMLGPYGHGRVEFEVDASN